MNKLYNDTAVQAIANAIRAKNGGSDTYTIAEMSTALNDISYYAKPIISNVLLATFEADGLPLNSLKVSVEAKQAGSGTPSPENVRPISGWDAVVVTDTDDVDNPTVTQTTTISLGQTVYGGELDVVNGVLTVVGILETVDASKFVGTSGGGLGWTDFNDSYVESLQNNNVMCNKLGDIVDGATGWTSTTPCIAFKVDTNTFRLYGNSALFSSGGAYENTSIYYKLKTPITIPLTPSLTKSLNGTNNLSVDCGDIIELEYFKEV